MGVAVLALPRLIPAPTERYSPPSGELYHIPNPPRIGALVQPTLGRGISSSPPPSLKEGTGRSIRVYPPNHCKVQATP